MTVAMNEEEHRFVEQTMIELGQRHPDMPEDRRKELALSRLPRWRHERATGGGLFYKPGAVASHPPARPVTKPKLVASPDVVREEAAKPGVISAPIAPPSSRSAEEGEVEPDVDVGPPPHADPKPKAGPAVSSYERFLAQMEQEEEERQLGRSSQAAVDHIISYSRNPGLVNRDQPRKTARLILARYLVGGVSRLRCQGGVFWLWEGGTYQRQGDGAITKLVSDFLDGSLTGGGEAFHPKRRDVEEVLAALRVEAFLDDRFVAPCWLPGGEPATDWIVCRNGVVNVRTGEMRAHSHTLWAHGTLDWDWLPGAGCPVFDGFLESVFPGDPEAQSSLVEAIGYSMTLDVWAQKGILLLGASRAGKGTIIRLAQGLVGPDEAISTSFDQWLKSDLSPYLLIGKRVIAFPDTRLKKGQQYGANYDAGDWRLILRRCC
jgi:hypothetical protein